MIAYPEKDTEWYRIEKTQISPSISKEADCISVGPAIVKQSKTLYLIDICLCLSLSLCNCSSLSLLVFACLQNTDYSLQNRFLIKFKNNIGITIFFQSSIGNKGVRMILMWEKLLITNYI